MRCSLNPVATRLHKNLHRLAEGVLPLVSTCYFVQIMGKGE